MDENDFNAALFATDLMREIIRFVDAVETIAGVMSDDRRDRERRRIFGDASSDEAPK